VLRKVTSLMVTLMGLSLLVIAGELAVLTYGRAPAHALSGASLQASGLPAHAVGIAIPGVSGPAHSPSRLGPVEQGRQMNWMADLLASVRKSDLRQGTALGQLIQEGEYATRTGPTGTGPISEGGMAAAGIWVWAVLLTMIVLLGVSIMAERSEGLLVQPQAVSTPLVDGAQYAGALVRPAPAHPFLRVPRLPPRAPRPIAGRAPWTVLASTILGGPDADWERMRLVPT
jgi:hypothetical protein